jgi:RNA polymerase sigma factor (sigma-70 family)
VSLARSGGAADVFLGGSEDLAAVPSIGRATRVEGASAPEADLTRELYEQYATQIFRYCLHQLGSREEAEDAVQSTFLNAFRGIKRGIVPEIESAWLFKIAHNVCLSRRRSAWRRDRIESPTDFDVVEEVMPAPTRRADELIGLQDVLEQMPDQQRRAILLREWQGLSYREIGQELELTQAAVETLIFRARRSLAQGLEQPVVVERRKRKRLAAGALGNLVSAAQSFLLGGGTVVKVAAVVAVAGTGTVVATAPVVRHHPPTGHPKPPAAPVRPHHAAAPQNERSSVVVAPVHAARAPRRPPQQHAARATARDTRTAPVKAAVVPPTVAQPVVAETQSRHETPPARLEKRRGAGTKGEGRSTAPGRQKKVDPTPAAALPAAAPATHGKSAKHDGPGRQKKRSAGALPTTPPTPVEDRAASTAVPPAPEVPADNGNGNGKGRAK